MGKAQFPLVGDPTHQLTRAFGVHKARIEHLLNRYGVMTDELLDLLLRRKEPADDLDSPDVREVLGMLRTQPPGDTATQRSTANPQGNPT